MNTTIAISVVSWAIGLFLFIWRNLYGLLVLAILIVLVIAAANSGII